MRTKRSHLGGVNVVFVFTFFIAKFEGADIQRARTNVDQEMQALISES